MDGNAILRRSMSFAGSDQEILIEIDQPIRIDSMEFQCAIRISAAGLLAKQASAFGVDEMQSVMLAFDALRGLIGEAYPGATWCGLPVEIAFPRAIPYAAGVETYRQLETLVDEALQAKFNTT
ncbi:MAG: hypothetical protein R3D51_17020 [Hyphomicrobiaceae bacterium]